MAITLVSHLGSSVLLVAAGWVWFLGFSRSAAAGTVALFAAGMTLGAIGDFFNAGVLQELIKLPDPVLGGMAAFALGHVAYIAGCVRVSRVRDFRSRGRWLAAIGFWQAVGTVAWFFVVYCGTNVGARLLVWPAAVFAAIGGDSRRGDLFGALGRSIFGLGHGSGAVSRQRLDSGVPHVSRRFSAGGPRRLAHLRAGADADRLFDRNRRASW